MITGGPFVKTITKNKNMEFSITTNHQTGLAIKECFESKVLNLEKDKGMRITGYEIDSGYVKVKINCSPATKTQAVFFLGMHAQRCKKPDLNFNSFGNLPITEANNLFKIK